jgi:hypothetical protein
MIGIRLADPHDAGRIVEALHTAADVEDTPRPLVAKRYRKIAELLADAADRCPFVPPFRSDVDPD